MRISDVALWGLVLQRKELKASTRCPCPLLHEELPGSSDGVTVGVGLQARRGRGLGSLSILLGSAVYSDQVQFPPFCAGTSKWQTCSLPPPGRLCSGQHRPYCTGRRLFLITCG